jgi:CBS domain-containing protein
LKVSDVMTRDVLTVTADTPYQEIVAPLEPDRRILQRVRREVVLNVLGDDPFGL